MDPIHLPNLARRLPGTDAAAVRQTGSPMYENPPDLGQPRETFLVRAILVKPSNRLPSQKAGGT
mgnify:CR=1 FL=1